MYSTHQQDGKSLRQVVFEKYTQAQIFEHFMGIKVQFKKKVCNPFRTDKHADCQFFENYGKIRFIDFANNEWNGDCIDIVKKIHNCNFTEACFKIIQEMPFSDSTALRYGNPYSPTFTPRNRARFTCALRRWRKDDASFWKQWPISKKTLEEFFTYPTSWVRVGSIYVNIDEPSDPAYAYIYGNDEFKFMMPGREKKNRYRCNTAFPHGWLQLPKTGDICIIGKSHKESMWLKEHMGIPTWGPQSEGHMPEESKILEAKERFNTVISFMDFERAGIHTMWKMRNQYDIPAMYIGTGRFNTERFTEKDITDYSNTFGLLKAQRLCDKLINSVLAA
jgi:hypothetical protein